MLPRRIHWSLLLLFSIAAPAATAEPVSFDDIPFPPPKVPPENPITREKAELGRFLFYDERLSGNQTEACASCHRQGLAFSDGRERPVGSTGEIHPRNSMSLTNAAYGTTQAWANPLLRTLEQQHLVPLFGEFPVELGLSGRENELLARLDADRRYRRMFSEAFPEEEPAISLATTVRAIASFVRTLISSRSAFDRWLYDLDDAALSDSALRGLDMFFSERFECFHCHGGFNFSSSVTFAGSVFDEVAFHNTGLYNIGGTGAYPPDNTGLFEFTRVAEDMGRFKPPTLRNVTLTAPYMHDGSIATLDEVLDHYAAGGRTLHSGPFAGAGSENPFKSGFMVGFRLTAQERDDFHAFFESLTDYEFVSDPGLSDPFSGDFCPADCDLDREVGAAELVEAVRVAGAGAPLARCTAADLNGDGNVDDGELDVAIRALFSGCR